MTALLNYQCPRCGGVMIGVSAPPACYICGERMGWEHACCSHPMPEEQSPPEVLAPPAAPAMVKVLCQICQNDHPFIRANVPEKCPTCGAAWVAFVGCTDLGPTEWAEDDPRWETFYGGSES
jgi:rubrerythrin